jgi:geranylgeranyl pyrophosphate synthase
MRDHSELDDQLNEVRRIVMDSLQRTALCRQMARFAPSVGGGKMLRARLLLRVGSPAGVARQVLCRASAAVEMLHAASLLHDDIVDGGTRRRGAPALWVSEGARAAVLLGDLLVSLAAGEVQDALPARLPMLIATLREMCDAELEQDFADPDVAPAWDQCVGIARRKTGSLFGFAAACAGGADPARVEALHRAGYALGTAYQLADDLLDACPEPLVTDKSLGTDFATGKLTAASAFPEGGADPRSAITALLQESEDELAAWPEVQQAWRDYVRDVVVPLLAQYTGMAGVAVCA